MQGDAFLFLIITSSAFLPGMSGSQVGTGRESTVEVQIQ